MKVLFITQKVDRNDDVLGFVHKWLEKLAGKVDKLNVICLEKGEYELPDNVRVFSLGKEGGYSKAKHIFRFYKYIFKLQKKYDVVFCHMNAIYIVLGDWFFRMKKKKVFLWFNHPKGSLMAKIAIKRATKSFYTSSFSFTARFPCTQKMPAGIDTEIFQENTNIVRERNSILSLGRIAPIKHVDILVEGVGLLPAVGVDFRLNVAGGPGADDQEYFEKIKRMASNLGSQGKIKFLGKIKHNRTPEIYQKNEIFVNLTPSGSFDKTILESMACGCLPIVSNRSFEKVLPPKFIFAQNNVDDLAGAIKYALSLSDEQKIIYQEMFVKYVQKEHSLNSLIEKLISEMLKV